MKFFSNLSLNTLLFKIISSDINNLLQIPTSHLIMKHFSEAVAVAH